MILLAITPQVKSPPKKKQRIRTDDMLSELLSESESEEEVEEIDAVRDELNLYHAKKVPMPEAKPGEDKPPRPDRAQWWKKHTDMFPTLSKIANRVLAVPASSVPSERVFSVGGTLVSKKRSRLTPGHVEMLLCLNKNWK